MFVNHFLSIALLYCIFPAVWAKNPVKWRPQKDVYPKQESLWVRLHEKGGKHHEMPCQHNLQDWLREYIEAAGIGEDKNIPSSAHSDPKTTRLYDRRSDEVSMDEVERIGI